MATDVAPMLPKPIPPVARQTSRLKAIGPLFEVAWVKPDKSGDQRVHAQHAPDGGVTATSVPVRLLL
jgi:hypothetical protein